MDWALNVERPERTVNMRPACVPQVQCLSAETGVGRSFEGKDVQVVLVYAPVRWFPSDNTCGGNIGVRVPRARRAPSGWDEDCKACSGLQSDCVCPGPTDLSTLSYLDSGTVRWVSMSPELLGLQRFGLEKRHPLFDMLTK